MKDLKLGVRSKDAAKSAYKFFKEGGYIVPLRPEWEWPFLEELVRSHPIDKRDFEHFLMGTHPGILPSEILKDLKKRTERIPTLAVIRLTCGGEVEEIVKVIDANDLYNLQKEIEAV